MTIEELLDKINSDKAKTNAEYRRRHKIIAESGIKGAQEIARVARQWSPERIKAELGIDVGE